MDVCATSTDRQLTPGPYTFVLRATPEVPRMLQSKRRTVGIRVTDHPVTLAIARRLKAAIDAGDQSTVESTLDELARHTGGSLPSPENPMTARTPVLILSIAVLPHPV